MQDGAPEITVPLDAEIQEKEEQKEAAKVLQMVIAILNQSVVPDEYLRSLRIELGGNVKAGDVVDWLTQKLAHGSNV